MGSCLIAAKLVPNYEDTDSIWKASQDTSTTSFTIAMLMFNKLTYNLHCRSTLLYNFEAWTKFDIAALVNICEICFSLTILNCFTLIFNWETKSFIWFSKDCGSISRHLFNFRDLCRMLDYALECIFDHIWNVVIFKGISLLTCFIWSLLPQLSNKMDGLKVLVIGSLENISSNLALSLFKTRDLVILLIYYFD